MPISASSTIPAPMGKKRTRVGKHLERVRLELGLTLRQAKDRAGLYRSEIGSNTIRDIETGSTQNPGVKTLEAMARAYGLDPMDILALACEEPPESSPQFQTSPFHVASKLYGKAKPDKKKLADEMMKMVLQQLEE